MTTITTRAFRPLFLLLAASIILATGALAPGAPALGQNLIFSDDFETGDLSAWSSFVPVDAEPPAVTLVRPGATAVDLLTPEIEVAWLDGLSGALPESLVIELDGEQITEQCSVELARAVCPSPPLAVGNHFVRVVLDDRAGNRADVTFPFELSLTGGPRTAVLGADADTFLDQNQPDRPRGERQFLTTAENFPSLLRFGDDLPLVTENSVVAEARLFLTIDINLGDWAPGDVVELRRINVPFSEEATTWNCAEDTQPANNNADCAEPWLGGDFEPTPFATAFITDTTSGEISFDVTDAAVAILDADLANNGWALLPQAGSQGRASFHSREAGDGAPRLELVIDNDIDESTPELTFLEPLDGDVFVNNPAPLVRVALSDPDSPIAPDTFRLVSGLADLSGSCAVSTSEAICEIPALGEGIKNLRAEVFDEGGQRGTAEIAITVILDEQAPTLRLLSPTRSRVIAPAPPTLEVSFADTDSGIDTASFSASVDGQPLAGCAVKGDGATCDLDGLAEGPHTLSAQVSDFVGLVSQVSLDFELLLDATPPVLTAVSPLAPVFLPEGSVTIEVAWSDDDVGVVPISLLVLDGDVTLSDECAIGAVGAVCEVDLAEGTTQLDLSIEDQAGNVGTLVLPVTVSFDADFPTLQVTSPAEGEVVEVANPVVELAFDDVGAGLDAAGLELLVDGAPQGGTCSSGPSSATCPLPALDAGDHTLLARVRDLAGNVTEVAVNFEIMLADTEAPQVSFLSPQPGLSQGFGAPPIEISWSDASGLELGTASILADGDDITASCTVAADGASCPAPAFASGAHTVFARVLDPAGNIGTAAVNFELELELDIAIDTPAPGVLTGEGTITVSGTVSELAETVEVNGVAATVGGGTFSATGVSLAEGSNSLAAVARNSLGAVGTDTRVVVSDTVPPWLVITMPPDGLVTTEPQLIVTGEVANPTSSANDVEPPTVTVNNLPADVEQRAFALPDFLLQPGENVLRVEARDQVGNVGVREARVTYVPDAERKIVEMLGNDQSAEVLQRLPKPLIVRVVDFLDRPLPGRTVRFEVSRGDGTLDSPPLSGRVIEVTTDERGFAQTFMTLGLRSGSGNHEVTATSPGIPGQVIFCSNAEPGLPLRIVRIVGDNQLGAQTAIAGSDAPTPLYVQVFDRHGNPVPDVAVTFRVEEGGGELGTAPARAEAIVTSTDAEGKASVLYRLGPEPGINNHVVTADFPGLTERPAIFAYSAMVPGPEADTRVSGLVLDNQDRPVPGATLHIRDTALEAVSDAAGRFTISGAPVGSIFLEVDGETVTLPGVWPHLEFKLTTIAGQDNTIGKPIRLLPLDVANGAMVGGDSDVTLLLDGVPGAELTIFANSTRFPDGSDEGFLTFTQVHSDKVPMEAPMGSNFMLAWSVQPAGTIFDPPARISIPNADLPPGAVVDIFSFDHDLGEFIPIGTASVTEDGSQLISNPGFGMVKAGWHGCVPPPPPDGDTCNESPCTVCPPGATSPQPKCEMCENCDNGTCSPQELDGVTALANGDDGEDGDIVGATTNDIDFSADVDGNCDGYEYMWDFGDGNTAEGATPAHRYEEVGTYTVTVEVMCNNCDDLMVSDTVEVKIIEVDLVVDELPEEDEPSPNEEDPGRLLVVNDDDDDGDDMLDVDQSGSVSNEDDLVPAMIDLGDDPPSDGMLRLEALEGGDKIRAWEEETKGTEIMLPKTWDLASEMPPEMFYIEGIRSSDEEQDVELALNYENDNTPEPIEDQALLTVADLEFSVSPGEDAAVETSDSTFLLVAAAFIKKFGGEEDEIEPVEDGAQVEFEMLEGGGLGASSATTTFGLAAVTVTGASPGTMHRGKGTLKSFKLKDSIFDEELEVDREDESDSTEVSVSWPAEIELTSTNSMVAADGTATVSFTAIVRDGAGNTVVDGTPVSWQVGESDQPFDSQTTITSGGVASATLRAPLSARDQVVEVTSGLARATSTVQVVRVTGGLTASQDVLDIKTGDTATMTASVNAESGTEVFWFTSNGQISGGNVSGGSATATLSTTGGRPGPVVVLATVGDRLLAWLGAFTSSDKVSLTPQDPFLTNGAEENRVLRRVSPSGQTRLIPIISSTTVDVLGPAGAAVILDSGGPTPLEVYNFDAADATTAPGLLNGRDMALAGPTVDTVIVQSGAASLHFQPGDLGTIDDDPLFSADGGLGVSLYVRPAQIANATLIDKGAAWSLDLMADGTVAATVRSSGGTFLAQTTAAMSVDTWYFVRLEAIGDELRLTLDNETVTVPFSGALDVVPEPILLGGATALLDGHVDDLSWFRPSETPSAGSFGGVGAGGLLQLDGSGQASFTIENAGLTLAPYQIVPLVVRARVSTSTVAELSKSGALGRDPAMKTGDCDGAGTVYVSEQTAWDHVTDAVGSFFGADPQGTAGVIANTAGGVLIVADVGAVVKNLWRMAGFSDTDPNYAELTLSGLGLATEFAVGIGEVADVPISAARAIVARLGNSPFGDLLVRRLKGWIDDGIALSQKEINLISRISDLPCATFSDPSPEDPEGSCPLAAVAAILKTDDDFVRAAKVLDEFGDDVLQRLVGVSDNFGQAVATKVNKVLGEVGDDALASLKNSGKLDEAITGMAKVLDNGIGDDAVKAALDNGDQLLGTAYKHDQLLIDMGEVADVTGFDGLIASLGRNNPNGAKGFRYELEIAAGFKRNGETVSELGKKIPLAGKANPSDIDVISNGVTYNAKISRGAFKKPSKKALEKAENYVAAALMQVGNDPSKVKYIVPDGVRAPSKVRKFLETFDPPIEIVNFPLTN